MLATNKQKLKIVVIVVMMMTIPQQAVAQEINTDGIDEYYAGSTTNNGYWNVQSPLPVSGKAHAANSCVFERAAANQVRNEHIDPSSERCPDCMFIAALLRGADLNRVVWIYFPEQGGYVGPIHVVDAKARHHINLGDTWVVDLGFNLRIAANAWNPTAVTLFESEPNDKPKLVLKPVRRANCFAQWSNSANRITYDWVTYQGPSFDHPINGGIGVHEIVDVVEINGSWARLAEGSFWIPTSALSWVEVK